MGSPALLLFPAAGFHACTLLPLHHNNSRSDCARAFDTMIWEMIWLEINVFFQQIVFQLGRLHDPCLCVASKSYASSVEGMQGQAWAPRGGKGWLNQAIAKHLTVTCSRTNRSSEDVAVTVYTAPGKRRAVRARARSPSSELYWSWQGDADLHHLRTCCTLSLCLFHHHGIGVPHNFWLL